MSEKQRFNRILKEIAVILGLGIAYFIFVSITGLYIPCPFRIVTGRLCPGCGISHYFVHMAHLDFKEAFSANQYIFVFVPLAIPYWLFKTYKYIKTGETKYSKIEIVILAIALISAIAFGIIRNIY
ncbi:MAG: DUF2752 domain-containing protein [Firmicutes bacterium]|nr:DUF2752 domain-containing protein [Bacillota bacterium]